MLYQEAKQAWWNTTRNEVDTGTDEIPGYEIETDDGTVEVKGVVHGFSKRFMSAPDDAVSRLNEEIAEQSEEGPVLLEEGFERMLMDDANTLRYRVEEMDDLEWAVQQDPVAALKYLGKQLAKLPVSYGMMKVAPHLSDRTESWKWGVSEAIHDGLEGLEHWDDTLDAIESYELPTHLEDEYKSEAKPAKNLMMEGRSIYQSEQAEAVLKDHDKVTLYVGMGHLPQIRDYFEHDQCDLSSTVYEVRRSDIDLDY
ncbi:MAG: hypothetical protein SVU32_03385, partial [Candidatus Nanohaloarchaea archaeon]|nr:hypothetical protein [Candidatus Nanohaloarchaea archaeon]